MHPTLEELPPRIVFFDGVCVFCNDTTRWLVERDPQARLHFAPLQGATAELLRSEDPFFPEEIDTLVYADLSLGEPRIVLRSQAVLEILATLGPLPVWLRALRALPVGLRDLGYHLFVRFRYRIFGKLEACPLPIPEERDRFLN